MKRRYVAHHHNIYLAIVTAVAVVAIVFLVLNYLQNTGEKIVVAEEIQVETQEPAPEPEIVQVEVTCPENIHKKIDKSNLHILFNDESEQWIQPETETYSLAAIYDKRVCVGQTISCYYVGELESSFHLDRECLNALEAGNNSCFCG